MRNLPGYILVAIPALAFATQDLNVEPGLKAIIDSTAKKTEMPYIDKSPCCPVCPGKDGIAKGEDCRGALPIESFSGKIDKRSAELKILTGSRYEVLRKLKDKKIFIRNRDTLVRYFTLDPVTHDISGDLSFEREIPEKRFVREYEKLREIYSDVKFMELCRYLAENAPKYSKLKDKLQKETGGDL